MLERVTHFRGHKPSAPRRQPPPQHGPPRNDMSSRGSTQAVQLGRGVGGDRGLPGKWLGLGNSREDRDGRGWDDNEMRAQCSRKEKEKSGQVTAPGL